LGHFIHPGQSIIFQESYPFSGIIASLWFIFSSKKSLHSLHKNPAFASYRQVMILGIMRLIVHEVKMKNTALWFGLVALALLTAGCASANTESNSPLASPAVDTSSSDPAVALSDADPVVPNSPQSGLSDAEAAGLVFMREEEKLAYDIYMDLYAQWGTPLFQNIANSEWTHTQSVKTLLDRYGLPDPSAGLAEGQFNNPELQALYDQLIQQGSQSLEDAFKVGAAIEEIDILDLQERLDAADEPDILQVYGNLLAGSENHLRAFVSQLENRSGSSYQPQYLSAGAYAQIIAGQPGYRGGAGSGGQGQGGGNSN